MTDLLGHSNIFATLSQVLTNNSTSFIYRPRGRVNIRLSLQKCKGGRIVFSAIKREIQSIINS